MPQSTKNQPSRGGSRLNAGRKLESGSYKEATQAIRLPKSLVEKLTPLLARYKEQIKVNKSLENCGSWLISVLEEKEKLYRLYLGAVSADPNRTAVADEEFEEISLIAHPEKTYLVNVVGDSMIDADIQGGDTLVVEEIPKGVEPVNGEIVIAAVGSGQRTVKLFYRESASTVLLVSANKAYPPMKFDGETQNSLEIQGIVKKVMRPAMKKVDVSSYLGKRGKEDRR